MTIKPFFGGTLFKNEDKFPIMGVGRKTENDMARLTLQCILTNDAITATVPGMSTIYEVDNAARAVCTDCHGTHNIVRQSRASSDRETADEWTPLFNGENLDNWSSSTNSWAVKRHSIIGVLAAPAKAADIWTQATYDNYLLSVTFRTTGPVRAGIWLKDQNGPRVEIFNQSRPPASPASVYLPGKGLVLVNHTSELFDDSGWNTISVKVQGNLVHVWLNAEQIGAVRTEASQQGRIGLHIEKSPAAEPAKFEVREILIKQLSENQQDN